jgi:hypothetical protein
MNHNQWCNLTVDVAPFDVFMDEDAAIVWEPIIQEARRLVREAYDARSPNF